MENAQKQPQSLMKPSLDKSGRTGTGTHEETGELPTWDDLMAALRQWLSVGGYAVGAQTDFPSKLEIFRRFLAERTAIMDAAGRVDLAAVDVSVLGDYQTHVYEYIIRRTGKRLKTTTQIHALSYVQSFFRFLHQTRRIVTNPAHVIKLPRNPQTVPADILTPEEARRLLAQPNIHVPVGFRDRAILELFWSTGIRINELILLAVDDIDFAQELCTIRHGKGGKVRVVPVGRVALDWLREYIASVRPLLLDPRRPTPILFLSRFCRPLDKTSVFYCLRTYTQRAKIKKHITTHSFRHTLASQMLESGADLRHIQTMLGHENLTTTQRYLHVAKGNLKKVHANTHPREVHGQNSGRAYQGEQT